MNGPNGKLGGLSEKAASVAPTNGRILEDIEFQFIENLPVGIALVELCVPEDSRTWRLTTANAIARQAIGDSLLDFLAGRLATVPLRNDLEDAYGQILRSRRPKKLRWAVTDVGGVRRTYSVTAFSVPPKHIGLLMQRPSMHAVTRTALTEQKRIQSEVSRAIDSFLWRGDPRTLETLWVSHNAQEILGYWPERWLSMPNFWLSRIHEEDREKVRKVTMGCNWEEKRFDYRMNAADGRKKWLHAVIRRIATADGAGELAGVMIDITARQLAEEQAHDLNGLLLRSQDEERRRVARELHDSLGQYLALLGMNLGRLSRNAKYLDDEQRRIFVETTDLVERCCREVRTMSYLMHPPMLDEVGLGPALEWYVRGFSERSGIEVTIEAGEKLKKLPKNVETALFRIAEEGLTNIYRHSGSKKATIRLRNEGDALVFELADDGKGMEISGQERQRDAADTEVKGVGIRGMRERMRELGGRLEVISGETGTTLRARVPGRAIAADREDTREQSQEYSREHRQEHAQEGTQEHQRLNAKAAAAGSRNGGHAARAKYR